MNKPRPVYSRKTGKLTGYKQEVKWRGQRRYFTRRTVAAAEACWARAIADFEAGVEPYDRYRHDPERSPGEVPERGWPETEAPPTTFGAWLASWHPRRRLSPRAAYNQGKIIDVHVAPHLGHLPLHHEQFTRQHVQEWVWMLEEEYSPRYVRTMFGVVRLALLDAVDEASVPLTASPAVRIRLEEADPTGRAALSPEQVAAVASRCGVHAELAWSLPFTGARIGELLGRDVGDWSWRTGITIAGKPVEVDASKPRLRKKGTRKAKASKTSAGARTIALCPSHGAMMRDYVGDRDGALYVGKYGQRATYYTVYTTIKRAAEAAREAGVDVPAGFSPHWLRKTARTWLSEDGIQRIAIDYRMGHATPGMQGAYEDPTPAMIAATTGAQEARWQRAMAAPGLLRETA